MAILTDAEVAKRRRAKTAKQQKVVDDLILLKDNRKLQKEVQQLTEWVNDCQAGMYINCVYCGHRYGPDDEVPATMAQVLKEHVEQCSEHPMSALRQELTAEKAKLGTAVDALKWAWGTIYEARGQAIEDDDSDEALEKLQQAIRAAQLEEEETALR